MSSGGCPLIFPFRVCVCPNQGLEELQNDVDEWIEYYNWERPHSGRYCYGKTPIQTFLDSAHLANEKQLDQYGEKSVKNQTQPDTSLSVR